MSAGGRIIDKEEAKERENLLPHPEWKKMNTQIK
jgi:hypothetical protein